LARVRVSPEIIEDLVFGYATAPVRITGCMVDLDRKEIVFEINGPDVPDVPEVRAIIHSQTNRAGQRLLTMTFEAVKP